VAGNTVFPLPVFSNLYKQMPSFRLLEGGSRMKKGILAMGLLLCIVMCSIRTNAEMKITSEGVKFPDNSTQTTAASGGGVTAPLNLSGSFNTAIMYEDPDGAVVSGVNVYIGHDARTYGGYFSAAGTYGSGVHGYTSGEDGIGVYGFAANDGNGANVGGHFRADGASGKGVSGWALNRGSMTNYGGYFISWGSSGRGVYGSAEYYGNATNYGGYFEAAGTTGRGVYGETTGTEGRAVYGKAKGASGIGVYGYGAGTSGIGVYGRGIEYDFYAGNGTYGPFTGAHEVKFSEDMPEKMLPGMVVSTTGKTEARSDESGKISVSSTLPTVKLSAKANDKAVFGVIVSEGPLPKDHWYESQDEESFGIVNALGEGRVWVTNRNGNIGNGDYVTTSEIPGYGQLGEQAWDTSK
jgi:hypothetical protein